MPGGKLQCTCTLLSLLSSFSFSLLFSPFTLSFCKQSWIHYLLTRPQDGHHYTGQLPGVSRDYWSYWFLMAVMYMPEPRARLQPSTMLLLTEIFALSSGWYKRAWTPASGTKLIWWLEKWLNDMVTVTFTSIWKSKLWRILASRQECNVWYHVVAWNCLHVTMIIKILTSRVCTCIALSYFFSVIWKLINKGSCQCIALSYFFFQSLKINKGSYQSRCLSFMLQAIIPAHKFQITHTLQDFVRRVCWSHRTANSRFV